MTDKSFRLIIILTVLLISVAVLFSACSSKQESVTYDNGKVVASLKTPLPSPESHGEH